MLNNFFTLANIHRIGLFSIGCNSRMIELSKTYSTLTIETESNLLTSHSLILSKIKE